MDALLTALTYCVASKSYKPLRTRRHCRCRRQRGRAARRRAAAADVGASVDAATGAVAGDAVAGGAGAGLRARQEALLQAQPLAGAGRLHDRPAVAVEVDHARAAANCRRGRRAAPARLCRTGRHDHPAGNARLSLRLRSTH